MKRTILAALICLTAVSLTAFGQGYTNLQCIADAEVNAEYPDSMNSGSPLYSYGPRDHNWGQRDMLMQFDLWFLMG